MFNLEPLRADEWIPHRVCCRWWWSQCWCASLVALRATWRGCVCAWSPPSSCTHTHTHTHTHTQSTGRSEIRGARVMLFAVTLTMQRQVTHSQVQFYPTAFPTIKINEVTHATGTLMRLEVTPHSSRAHTHTHTHTHTAVSGPLTAFWRHQCSRARQSGGGDVTAQRLPVKCI